MAVQDQAVEVSPEDRAEAAARDLADRGLPVTARAVRAEAGVRMAVAAQAAKAWREADQEPEAVPVPEVPGDVQGRLEAVWADAWRAALALLTPENERLEKEAAELRAEVEALTGTVTEVEEERDLAKSQAEGLAADLETVKGELAAARAEAGATATRVKGLEAERDRLDARLADLIAKLPAPTPKKTTATKTPARAASKSAAGKKA